MSPESASRMSLEPVAVKYSSSVDHSGVAQNRLPLESLLQLSPGTPMYQKGWSMSVSFQLRMNMALWFSYGVSLTLPCPEVRCMRRFWRAGSREGLSEALQA